MRNQVPRKCAAMLVTVMLSLMLTVSARAANIPTSLWWFQVAANDGNTVYSTPIFDESGNIYGTAMEGGTHGFGIVFKLSPTLSGLWEETVLYDFKGGAADGASPHSTLLRDGAGNLYGTTLSGGLNSSLCNESTPTPGCGIVFKLTPTTTGPWKETVLHRFTGPDGGNSFTGLVRDGAGNFYGATATGGSKGLGTVYKLALTSTGWKVTVLHNFTGNPDGATPFIHCAPLVFDSLGSLYGTTTQGGAAGAGIVFKLTPQKSGAWTEKILYSFRGGVDGARPRAEVILDHDGNVYGTTEIGGSGIYGTAFKLTAANGYTKTILYNFLGPRTGDAGFPNGLIFDGSGNLYGTSQGGGPNNSGTIFKLTNESGTWSETVLYNFTGGKDGSVPFVPMTIDAHGDLYSSSTWGGPAGSFLGGVVFKFIP